MRKSNQVKKQKITRVVLAVIVIGLLIFTLSFIIYPSLPANAWAVNSNRIVTLSQVAEGLNRPVTLTNAKDGSGRLFIVEQRGRITIMNNGVLSDPFLNIEGRVRSLADGGGGEEGLLGLAFPPSFSEKGYFYVYYTILSGDNVLARFSVADPPNAADPASEEQILVFPHPNYTNHNGGQLAFGPDGYLYIGTGDGGGGGDPQGNAQDPGSLNGKILRIDVENEPPDGENYLIPGDNPFLGDPNYREEIWALGLRNPWRFSFDQLTGDLYIADVGQSRLEEVNFQGTDSAGGENYGWNILEGDQCYSAATCDTSGMTMPVHTYPNEDPECSITGGYVYRGTEYPDLQGLYIFGDFCSGKIWGLQQNNGNWEHVRLTDTSLQITTFGEDEAGELYAADFSTGSLYKIEVTEFDFSHYLPMIGR